MTLETCLALGIECDCTTIGEALRCIGLQAVSMFAYDKIEEELAQLERESLSFYRKTNFIPESKSKVALAYLRASALSLGDSLSSKQ